MNKNIKPSNTQKNIKILYTLKLTGNVSIPITKRRLILIALITLAFIGLGWYVTKQIITTRQISQARSSHESVYDNDRDKKIDALHNIGVIDTTTPAYSSKIDACYVTHNDSGWVADNWYQDCYIRHTDLFSISLSRSDIEQKLKTSKDIPVLFGKLETSQSYTCDTLYRNGSVHPTLIYLDWNVDKTDMGLDCVIPNPTQDTFTVNGPILLDEELTTKIERSFDVNSVDKTKKYLSMQSDNYYYHESLGCGIGIMCPSPRKQPLTGF